jgi:hypothetical protein
MEKLMGDVSYELYMANKRLLERRTAVEKERARLNGPPALAWGQVERPQEAQSQPAVVIPERPGRLEPARLTEPAVSPLTEITLSPTLASAFLQYKVTAPARVWLLLRCLDGAGRGWLDVAEVRRQLTTNGSSYRVCDARHLRTLLREGDGRFWQRDGFGKLNHRDGNSERIWLRSTAKVAARLGVERVRGRPVVLPLAVLTGSIGDFRAHLYAAFHSGRDSTGSAGGERPVSRATMSQVSGVSRRTQQAYEKRAGVEVRPNYALGERMETAAMQERCWQKGTAVFPFRDVKGKRGRPGGEYSAWQMPNSYEGPHQTRPKSHNRRLNRKLADLCRKRDMGNGRSSAGSALTGGGGGGGRCGATHAGACNAPVRLYFENGAAIGKAINRRWVDEGYWPGFGRFGRRPGRPRLWFWVGI